MTARAGPPGARNRAFLYHLPVAEIASQTLDQQLEELGAQLAWVREYL